MKLQNVVLKQVGPIGYRRKALLRKEFLHKSMPTICLIISLNNWIYWMSPVPIYLLLEKRCNSNFLDDEYEELIQTIQTSRATPTPKIWISTNKAVGIESRAGKSGGTTAHPEMAEAFRAWLFPEVMLEMVKRYRCYQPELDRSLTCVNETES